MQIFTVISNSEISPPPAFCIENKALSKLQPQARISQFLTLSRETWRKIIEWGGKPTLEYLGGGCLKEKGENLTPFSLPGISPIREPSLPGWNRGPHGYM